MREIFLLPEWLLQKCAESSCEKLSKICITLWGIWYWRNMRVWEEKMINFAIAMEGSFHTVEEWRKARCKQKIDVKSATNISELEKIRWSHPEGTLKVNVDAAFYEDAPTCTIGMLIRDHRGSFSGKGGL